MSENSSEKIWIAIITGVTAITVAGIKCYESCHRDNAKSAGGISAAGVLPNSEEVWKEFNSLPL